MLHNEERTLYPAPRFKWPSHDKCFANANVVLAILRIHGRVAILGGIREDVGVLAQGLVVLARAVVKIIGDSRANAGMLVVLESNRDIISVLIDVLVVRGIVNVRVRALVEGWVLTDVLVVRELVNVRVRVRVERCEHDSDKLLVRMLAIRE